MNFISLDSYKKLIQLLVNTNPSLQLLLETYSYLGGLLSVEAPLWPFCESFRDPDLHYLGGPDPCGVKASDNVAAIVSLQTDRVFGIVGDEIAAHCLDFVIVGVCLD